MKSFLDNFDLDDLPVRENQTFEYKRSCSFEKIAEKLPIAASAFWNSGGGSIFFGVDDDTGRPDGGIPLKKGRQDTRDWLDNYIGQLAPSAPYEIRLYEPTDAPSHNITPGNCVAAIHFLRCRTAPVMGPNSVYYIRAGARSETASAFLVEALFANRSAAVPVVVHTLRQKPSDNETIQLGIVSLTNSPALNVKIDFEPRPKRYHSQFSAPLPLNIPVVNKELPVFFDYGHWYEKDHENEMDVEIKIEYNDLLGDLHQYSAQIDVKRCISPMISSDPLKTVLAEIRDAIKRLEETKRAR